MIDPTLNESVGHQVTNMQGATDHALRAWLAGDPIELTSALREMEIVVANMQWLILAVNTSA